MNWYGKSVLASHIQAKKAYRDTRSLEKATGVLKTKFKLAGYFPRELDVFNFFVMTTSYDACDKFFTVTVLEREWLGRDTALFSGDSYIDAKKIEVLTDAEVLGKIQDSRNKFLYVAELPINKWKELKKMHYKVPISKKKIPIAVQNAMAAALSESTARIVKKLGI